MKKKILFACDLDNTLLISHRQRQNDDICVEYVQGKEQSFMTVKAIDLLRKIQQEVDFVPVTTRSIEQYQRIKWPNGCEPEWAVTTNGAVLLHKGVADEKWSQCVKVLIDNWLGELQIQYERQEQSANYIRCRIVDNSYLFLYCDEEADVKAIVEHCREQTNLIVEGVGRKIYFFPPGMDKGWALMQLKEHLGDNYAFSAGDSPIDESMLKLADEAIAGYGLHVELDGVCWHQPLETVYSEWLLEKVLERLSEKE